MFHLVPSQVMRKYLEEEHWLFTDWQKATLIWNSPIHTKTEILEALKELADTTADTILKRQILERLTYEEKAYRLLNDNSQGKYVYLLRIDDCIRGVFADYETARRYGSKKCEEEDEMIYTVEKQLIYGESTKQDVAIPRFSPHNILQPELPSREECIGISSGDSMHKAGGECLTWDSCEISAEEEERVDSLRKDRFEYQFFRIPFGMEAGTIVRYKSTFTESPEYGILLTGASDWQQYMNHMEVVEWKDFLDIQVEVVFLRERGYWSHEHINPLYLEADFPETEEGQDEKRKAHRAALLAFRDFLHDRTKEKDKKVIRATTEYAAACKDRRFAGEAETIWDKVY